MATGRETGTDWKCLAKLIRNQKKETAGVRQYLNCFKTRRGGRGSRRHIDDNLQLSGKKRHFEFYICHSETLLSEPRPLCPHSLQIRHQQHDNSQEPGKNK